MFGWKISWNFTPLAFRQTERIHITGAHRASISKDLYSWRWYKKGLLFLFFWTSEIWPIYITLALWNWDHHISFNIFFQKNATPSLRDINMHVKEGQLVAVVGSVGSGTEFSISGWKILFLISTKKWLNRWTNSNIYYLELESLR